MGIIEDTIRKYHINQYFDDINVYIPGMKIETFPKNTYVRIDAREQSRGYFLLKGEMQAHVLSENGKQMLVRHCDDFIFIGDMELLQCVKNFRVIETVTACVFLSIDFNRYRDVLLSDRKFLLYLCRGLADKLNVFEEVQFRNRSVSAKEKVIAYILEKSKNGIFKEKITKMCDRVGVSYRHIYRIIDELMEEGLLERTNEGYHIVSEEQLKG